MKEHIVATAGRDVSILFQFFHPLDVKRVLKQGLWSFDKHILILSVIPEGMVPQEDILFDVPYWIQVHNVLVGNY